MHGRLDMKDKPENGLTSPRSRDATRNERLFLVPVRLLTDRRPGAIVTVTFPDGVEYRGRVVSIEGDTADVQVFERLELPTESFLPITLIQALPKKERMELIIQKATELGVTAIRPCESARSITLEERDASQHKSHRWPAVVEKAVEQCRRKLLPELHETSSLTKALEAGSSADVRLLLYERETITGLHELRDIKPASVTLVCGPEGGFTEDEASLAKSLGYTPVRLGGRILRCETAAIAALSIVQFMWGDL